MPRKSTIRVNWSGIGLGVLTLTATIATLSLVPIFGYGSFNIADMIFDEFEEDKLADEFRASSRDTYINGIKYSLLGSDTIAVQDDEYTRTIYNFNKSIVKIDGSYGADKEFPFEDYDQQALSQVITAGCFISSQIKKSTNEPAVHQAIISHIK